MQDSLSTSLLPVSYTHLWLPAAEAERIVSVLEALGLPVFHPLLSRRTEDGACEVLKGLEAFRRCV